MIFHVGQIIEYCPIDIENIVDLVANIFVYSLVDEAKEHISLTLMIPISKCYIRVTMCLSEYQFLDNMSIFSRACACEHHELMTIRVSFYNF